jgi:hypothetical protein
MAACLSCVCFGGLDSNFIVSCCVGGFAFQLQIQGTLKSQGKFCIPNSADRCSYRNVQYVWLLLLLHIQLQHVILPGNDFFLAAFGTISWNIFNRHAHLDAAIEIKELVF